LLTVSTGTTIKTTLTVIAVVIALVTLRSVVVLLIERF
jgi:hypothetical protein